MASKIKVDQIQTADGTGTIALQNQLSGMTSASMPTGSVLQVTSGESTSAFSTSSTSWVAVSTLQDTITTVAANSKILITMTAPWQLQSSASIRAVVSIRSSVDSYAASLFEQIFVLESNWHQLGNSMQFLHSPSQAAGTAITYKGYTKRHSGSGSIYLPDLWGANTSGVPTSIVTLMEIAG